MTVTFTVDNTPTTVTWIVDEPAGPSWTVDGDDIVWVVPTPGDAQFGTGNSPDSLDVAALMAILDPLLAAKQDTDIYKWGAILGVTDPPQLPEGRDAYVFILGPVTGDTIQFPDCLATSGHRITVVNYSGAILRIDFAGNDRYSLSGAGYFDMGVSAFELIASDIPNGVGGHFWLPGNTSGADFDLPFFRGAGVPDGYVVEMTDSGEAPQWRKMRATNVAATSNVNGPSVRDVLDDLAASVEPPEWFPADDHVVTTNLLHCDYVAGLPDASGGAWVRVGNIADLTDGVDMQCLVRLDYPTVEFPDDAFMELLTQVNPLNTGQDNWEWAFLWSSSPTWDATGLTPGVAHLFWESTPIGESAEIALGYIPAGIRAGRWIQPRLTVDFATATATMWRAVQYPISADCEQLDGVWYYPLFSDTDVTKWSSIDTGVAEDWFIGLRLTGDIAWMRMTNFDGSAVYIDIQPATLDALTPGVDNSFVDTADTPNTWTTIGGSIVAP